MDKGVLKTWFVQNQEPLLLVASIGVALGIIASWVIFLEALAAKRGSRLKAWGVLLLVVLATVGAGLAAMMLAIKLGRI